MGPVSSPGAHSNDSKQEQPQSRTSKCEDLFDLKCTTVHVGDLIAKTARNSDKRVQTAANQLLVTDRHRSYIFRFLAAVAGNPFYAHHATISIGNLPCEVANAGISDRYARLEIV
jgi:hypothetical protein